MPAPHRFQMTSSQYLYLWRRRQLIEAFGGHADVFANLLVAAHPDWDQALAMAMPSAVITGPECLRRAAWITQIPNRPDVAVLASSRLFATGHFNIRRQSAAWFEQMRPGMLQRDAGQPRAPTASGMGTGRHVGNRRLGRLRDHTG